MAAITDPAFAPAKYPGIGSGHNLFSKYGSGVQFSAGFGDGGYDIWAWIVDYGTDESDERIAQIVVTLIDDEDLAVPFHDIGYTANRHRTGPAARWGASVVPRR